MLELLESRISGSSLFQLLTFLLYKVSINFWSIVSGGDVQALIQVQVQYQQNIVGGLKYVATLESFEANICFTSRLINVNVINVIRIFRATLQC